MTDKRGCVDSEYTIEEPELLWLENDEDKCQGVDCYECLIEQPRADIVLMGFVGEMEHSRHGEQNDERKGYQLVGCQNAEVEAMKLRKFIASRLVAVTIHRKGRKNSA